VEGKCCNTQGRCYSTKTRYFDFRDTFSQTLSDEHGTVAVGLRQDYYELIPTESRRSINGPKLGTQIIGQQAERYVAGIVTSLIVNVFEIVEV